MEGKEAFRGHSAQVVDGVGQSGTGHGPLAGLGPVPGMGTVGPPLRGQEGKGQRWASPQAHTVPCGSVHVLGADSLFHRPYLVQDFPAT